MNFLIRFVGWVEERNPTNTLSLRWVLLRSTQPTGKWQRYWSCQWIFWL